MSTSACIIAACAANARARKKEEPVHIHTEEYYYKVAIREYNHFKSMHMSLPIEYNESLNTYSMRGVSIAPSTVAFVGCITVKESMCPNGIDTYIRDNLDSIISSAEWRARHAEMLADYCTSIKQEYSVDLDPTYINYTTEYYWEVTIDETNT